MSDVRDGLAAGSWREGAAELALRRVGLDGSRLTKIVRKAVVDYYADVGGHLGGERLDDCVSFVRERMLGELGRFDAALAGGVRVETWVYRRSRPRVIDWLRTKGEGLEFGDARSGSQGRVGLTSDGELDLSSREEADTLDDAVERLAGGLTDRSAWTLRHVASGVAAGHDLVEVLEGLMGDLADELGVTMPAELRAQLRTRPGRFDAADGILGAVRGMAA